MIITTPAGAVTKYYDERVRVCVCVCVGLSICPSVREGIFGARRAIIAKFLCVLPLGPPLDE